MDCKEGCTWSCGQCTLINNDSDLECRACGTTQPMSSSSTTPSAPSSSQRARQTNGPLSRQNGNKDFNVSANDKNIPEDKKSATAGASAGGTSASSAWQCCRCTLMNSAKLKRCSVCESPRVSNIPTDLPSDIDEQGHRSPPPRSNGLNSSKSDSEFNDYQTDDGPVPQPPPEKHINVPPPIPKGKGKAGTSTDPIYVTGEDEDEWKCLHCTFSCNPGWATVCDSCRQPRKAGQGTPTSPIQIGKDSVKYIHRSPAPSAPEPTPGSSSSSQDDSTREESGLWQCGQCTFENPSAVVLCTMCGAGRPRSASNAWVCSQCTLENEARFPSCRICKSPRAEVAGGSGSNSAHKPPPGSWHCSCCTFLNKQGNKCRVCGVFKDGTSTNQRLRPLTPLCCSPSPQTSWSTSEPASPPTPGGMHREESLLMEDIQKLVEQDALERRGIIMAFCREVGDKVRTGGICKSTFEP